MTQTPQRRRNLFGWGRRSRGPVRGTKAAKAPRRAVMTIGAASRAARAAGVASGDTGGFSQWLKAKGLDQRGASVRQLLERRYREGVEKGTERSGTGAVLPGKTPAAGREFRFEGYDVRPSGEGWTVPRIDPASVFDTPALARQFIKSWIKGRENPAGRKRAAMKKPGGAAVTFDKTFTSGTLKGMTVPVRIGFSSPAAARAYVSRTASLRGRTGREPTPSAAAAEPAGRSK